MAIKEVLRDKVSLDSRSVDRVRLNRVPVVGGPSRDGGGKRVFGISPAAEAATFHPVDPDRWPDLVRLFEHHGNPGYCWCMRWRLPGRAFNALGVPGRKAALEERVRAGEAIGILGYLDGEPVGWCSIARRETYAALERSRDLRRVDDRPAWAVVCFYLRPRARGRGFARRLLQAAVSFARARGATVVEGYPPEPGATSYRWMGSVATFEAAGFRDVGAAGRRRIMRYVVDQGGSGLGACAANRSATLTTDGRTRDAVGVGRDIEKRRDDMERTELGRRTGSFAPGIAVEAKRLVFVSGQVSTDANGQVVGKGDVGAQARQAFKNVEVVLAQAGASLQDVVKITTFLVPMERYGEFAAVRAEVFGDRYPASSTVGVASLVSSDYLIEIEAVAVIA